MACSKLNYDTVARNYGDICWLETKNPVENTRDVMRTCCPVGSEVLITDGGCFSYCSITDEERQHEWASCMAKESAVTNFLGKLGVDAFCLFDGEGTEGGRELRVRDSKGDLAIAKAIEGIIGMVETVIVSVPVGTRTSTSGQGSTTLHKPTATSKQSTSTSQQASATSTPTPLYFAITNSSSITTNSSLVSNTSSIALPPKSNTTLSNPPSLSNGTTGISNATTVLPPPTYPNTTKSSPTSTLVPAPASTSAAVSTAPTPHSTAVLHVPGVVSSGGRTLSVGSFVVLGLLVSGFLL